MTIRGAGGGSLHNNDRELYPHLREKCFNLKKEDRGYKRARGFFMSKKG